MHEQEASRQPFRGLARDRAGWGEEDKISGARIDAKGDTGDACLTRRVATGGVLPGITRADARQKERAPAMPEPSRQILAGLALSATAAGAGATQKFPKPTHLKSPVSTAHEEQLTEPLP
jgi:hypothetical protein